MQAHHQLRGTSRRIATTMAYFTWGDGKRFRVKEVERAMVNFFDEQEIPSTQLIELCLGQFARLNLVRILSHANGIFALTNRGELVVRDILERAMNGEEDFAQAVPPSLRISRHTSEVKVTDTTSPITRIAPIGARGWGAT